jgi:hypothetical protein
MGHLLTVRVHYPLHDSQGSGSGPGPGSGSGPASGRRLALRTERDWDADVEPDTVAGASLLTAGTGCRW